MRATIVHESRGRLRLRLRQKNLTLRQADLLETWLKGQPWVREAAVHERTGCIIVTFTGERETVLSALGAFTWAGAEASVALPDHSTRAMNREFQEKLVGKVAVKAAATLFLPAPLRIARVIWHMAPFLRKGLRCLGRRQIKVELLDALSIGISACRRDFGTAGTVMFLLEIGELLEDWTRKKSVADLAESLSLHVDRVWLKNGNDEDPILATLYGGAGMGVGLGLVFSQGATTGGTDIIGKLLKLKFPWLPIGKLVMIPDMVVVILAAVVFGTVNAALYGLIQMYLLSKVMDMILYGWDTSRVAYIITDRWEETVQGLLDMNRGVTLLQGKGAYTGAEKQVLLVAFRQREIVPIKRMLREIDPKAFFIVCDAHEILGEGFGDYQKEEI